MFADKLISKVVRSQILLFFHFEYLFWNRYLRNVSIKGDANIWTFPEPMACLELMCDKIQNAQPGTTLSKFCLHQFLMAKGLISCHQFQRLNRFRITILFLAFTSNRVGSKETDSLILHVILTIISMKTNRLFMGNKSVHK